jgi:hypothetical protein
MPTPPTTSANVKQAVPFFGVTDMEASLRFYVDGLGFKMKHWWIPHRIEDNPDGKIRWCWLERGDAALMLQEFYRNVARRKHSGPERPSASCAKTHWHSIASSSHAEYKLGAVRLLAIACG